MAEPTTKDAMKNVMRTMRALEQEPPKTEKDIVIKEFEEEGKTYLLCPSLSQQAYEQYLQEFEEGLGSKGNVMTITREPLLTGRLLRKLDLSGQLVYLAALEIVGSGRSDLTMENDQLRIENLPRDKEIPRTHIRNILDGEKHRKTIILDVSRILDEAVSLVNFFRHKVPESPFAEMIMSVGESRKPSKEIVKERLDLLCPEKDDVVHVERSLEILRRKIGMKYMLTIGTDKVVDYVFRAIRFNGNIVRSTMEQDDVEHVIKLCNHIARSSLVFSVARDSVSKWISIAKLIEIGYRREQKEGMDELFGKMAELANGSSFLRLGDMERKMVVEGPGSDERAFFQLGVVWTLRKLMDSGFSASTRGEQLYEVLSKSEEEWKEASAAALEEISKHIGFSFYAIPGIIDLMDQINNSVLITKDDLPSIASVWRRNYSK